MTLGGTSGCPAKDAGGYGVGGWLTVGECTSGRVNGSRKLALGGWPPHLALSPAPCPCRLRPLGEQRVDCGGCEAKINPFAAPAREYRVEPAGEHARRPVRGRLVGTVVGSRRRGRDGCVGRLRGWAPRAFCFGGEVPAVRGTGTCGPAHSHRGRQLGILVCAMSCPADDPLRDGHDESPWRAGLLR